MSRTVFDPLPAFSNQLEIVLSRGAPEEPDHPLPEEAHPGSRFARLIPDPADQNGRQRLTCFDEYCEEWHKAMEGRVRVQARFLKDHWEVTVRIQVLNFAGSDGKDF
jgi:hypothetical protein